MSEVNVLALPFQSDEAVYALLGFLVVVSLWAVGGI